MLIPVHLCKFDAGMSCGGFQDFGFIMLSIFGGTWKHLKLWKSLIQ